MVFTCGHTNYYWSLSLMGEKTPTVTTVNTTSFNSCCNRRKDPSGL